MCSSCVCWQPGDSHEDTDRVTARGKLRITAIPHHIPGTGTADTRENLPGFYIRVLFTKCVCVFRCQPTVMWTRWPTVTWPWCLVLTCSGDGTTPCHSAPLGQSTTSPEPCWTSSIWSLPKPRPFTLQSFFQSNHHRELLSQTWPVRSCIRVLLST